jgi:hypothetical protein
MQHEVVDEADVILVLEGRDSPIRCTVHTIKMVHDSPVHASVLLCALGDSPVPTARQRHNRSSHEFESARHKQVLQLHTKRCAKLEAARKLEAQELRRSPQRVVEECVAKVGGAKSMACGGEAPR